MTGHVFSRGGQWREGKEWALCVLDVWFEYQQMPHHPEMTYPTFKLVNSSLILVCRILFSFFFFCRNMLYYYQPVKTGSTDMSFLMKESGSRPGDEALDLTGKRPCETNLVNNVLLSVPACEHTNIRLIAWKTLTYMECSRPKCTSHTRRFFFSFFSC